MMTLAPANSPYTYDTTTDGGDLKDKNGTLLAHSLITITQTDNTPVAIYSVAKFTLMGGAVLNVVGPKPLMSLKLAELSTGRFQTVIPGFDTRTAISFGATEACRHDPIK